MSWVEKEMKKRAAAVQRASTILDSRPADEPARMNALWQRFEAANGALPEALRLAADAKPPLDVPPGEAQRFIAWLKAPNGAALGFTGDAIRYVWPEPGARRSHNFWIRWHAERGPMVSQRVNTAVPPLVRQTRFDERRIDRMLRCLVTGRRISVWSVRRKRLGIF
jgi:hypothetical protein